MANHLHNVFVTSKENLCFNLDYIFYLSTLKYCLNKYLDTIGSNFTTIYFKQKVYKNF